MPKTLLTGTLEEQCAFLFNLAQEKAAVGNYSGAKHALKEILKHAPNYPGAAELMVKVSKGKQEQNMMLAFVFGFAVIAVAIGTIWQVPNDLWFIGLIVAGAIVGFLVGNAIALFRNRNRNAENDLPEEAHKH